MRHPGWARPSWPCDPRATPTLDGARPRLRADPRRRQRAAARVLPCGSCTSWSRAPSTPASRVAQTPYSSYPGSATRLERIAGATTDLQHIVHQGMTHYDATFWVGANAILRKRALEDIVESRLRGRLGDPALHPGPHRHRGHRVHASTSASTAGRCSTTRSASAYSGDPARLRLAVHPAAALGQRRPAHPLEAAQAVEGPQGPRRAEPLRRGVPAGQLHGVDLLVVDLPVDHALLPVQQRAAEPDPAARRPCRTS